MDIKIHIPTIKLRRPRFRKPRKLVVFIVVLVILGLLGGIGYKVRQTMQGPAIGTITLSASANDPKPKPELEEFDGNTFTFVHPLNFVEQTAKQQPNASQLEAHTFLSTGMTGEYLTIVISKASGSPIENDPSYASRAQNPKVYQRKVLTVKGEPVTVFTSNDGSQFQQAAFWLHKDKEMSFVLTGIASNTSDMTAEYTAMVQSISWK